LWVLSAKPGSCHSPGAWNVKLPPTFMENLCTSGVDCWKGAVNWKVLRDSTEVTGCVNCRCNSVPQVARHILLCVSQSTYPEEHTRDVMQILCSQCCAGFATNVSSDEVFTCVVRYLLNRREIIFNYTQQSTTRNSVSFSASQ
jgi:hypothetical protein